MQPILPSIRCSPCLGVRLRCSTLAAAAALAVTCDAGAFESFEHHAMANLALDAAIAYERQVAQGPEGVAARRASVALPAMQALRDKDHYGQIAACVDYFLYPEKMLAFAWKPEAGSDRDGIPVRDSFPLKALEDQCRQGASFLQASHSNHAHFQQDLLISVRVWHAMAIGVARDEENLFGALFINAMADHYLQDFFAPGHIVTPRDIKTDVPATAMHDKANIDGALFETGVLKGSLRDVVSFLCTGRVNAAEPRRLEDCNLAHPVVPAQVGAPDDAARALLELLSDHPAPTLFKGDAQLFTAGQLRQRVLLLAVETQSVLDVAQGTNSLRAERFGYDETKKLPLAEIDFGRYAFAQATPTPASVPADVAAGKPPTAASPPDRPLYKLGSASPILFASDARESQSSGHFMARNLYTIGFSTGSWLPNPPGIVKNWMGAVEGDFSLGLTYYKQGGDHGRGISANLALTLPETEGSIGPYYRFMSHQYQGRNVWRSSGGLRFEGGFSSYLTFFLTGGWDYSADIDRRLVGGRTWGGGLRVSLPVSRIGPTRDKIPDPVEP